MTTVAQASIHILFSMTSVAPKLITFSTYISTENELEYVIENEVASSTIRQ